MAVHFFPHNDEPASVIFQPPCVFTSDIMFFTSRHNVFSMASVITAEPGFNGLSEPPNGGFRILM